MTIGRYFPFLSPRLPTNLVLLERIIYEIYSTYVLRDGGKGGIFIVYRVNLTP